MNRNRSRFYAAPGVPIHTKVIGGRSPYATAPHDYRLPARGGNCPCRHNHKDIVTCNCVSNRKGLCLGQVPGPGPGQRVEAFPRRAELCAQNYQYYSTREQLLTNQTKYNQMVEDRERRRGQRRHDIRRPKICPSGWFLSGDGFCRGPTGYSSYRRHARS